MNYCNHTARNSSAHKFVIWGKENGVVDFCNSAKTVDRMSIPPETDRTPDTAALAEGHVQQPTGSGLSPNLSLGFATCWFTIIHQAILDCISLASAPSMFSKGHHLSKVQP